MSGKSYTMREMKTIVEYLVDHKAYGEIRGRKMWMDFASTRLTSRTWQSLKETFLKRILPDITNPYYKLDVYQINSFKQGVDLAKDKNKLEFQSVNEDSASNEINGDNEQPGTSNKNEDKTKGEDTKCSKIVHNRASTETLILENCYETAEDIQRELENSDHENKNSTKSNKSVRDFIQYSEPLTPLLQEVLDDFATSEESSDKEPQMEIDEDYVAEEVSTDTNEVAQESNNIESTEKNDKNLQNSEEGKPNKANEPDSESYVAKKIQEKIVIQETSKDAVLPRLEDVMVLVDEALANCNQQNSEIIDVSTEKITSSNEISSAMTDTLIPNNQEAVQNGNVEEIHSPILPTHTTSNSESRLFSNSQSSSGEKNKKTSSPKKNNSSQNLAVDSDKSETTNNNDKTLLLNEIESVNKNEVPKSKSNTSTPTKKMANSPKKKHNKPNFNSITPSQVVNPCLKSVSLFDEQFSLSKYSDSDSNNDDSNKKELKKAETLKEVARMADEVIVLKSRSPSGSSNEVSHISDQPLSQSQKSERDKALANVFGFTSGTVSKKTKRVSHRKRTTSRQYLEHHHSSDSSDWTSASDSEFVSPPRGRRNRYAKKYLRPHSARIMSLEENGGLFVMHGKKIYPLVKDGKSVKNYLTLMSDSDPEEEDSYWKLKYVEERKRTAELQKLLEQSKGRKINKDISPGTDTSPILPAPIVSTKPSHDQINGTELTRRTSDTNSLEPQQDKTVKIKFTKNDQEVQLEGHWQHLNPVLAQVVQMFHKEAPGAELMKPPPNGIACVELSSRESTPNVANDPVVREKMDKIESEIFKEIEKEAKDEVVEDKKMEKNNNEQPKNDQETVNEQEKPNVTIRKKRGRPSKGVSSTEENEGNIKKRTRKSNGPNNKVLAAENAGKVEALPDKVEALPGKDSTPTVTSKRKTRSPRKLLEMNNDGVTPIVTEIKTTNRKRNNVKQAPEAPDDDDDFVRYKFPSPAPEKKSRKSATNKIPKLQTSKKDYNSHTTVLSPTSHSHHTVDSSQGYQDSDASPYVIDTKRKRRISVSSLSITGRRYQRKIRSKSYPFLTDDSSNESSNSQFKIISIKSRNSTANSDVYRSESYQLLMPQSKPILRKLEKIEEINTNDDERNVTKRKFYTSASDAIVEIYEDNVTHRNINADVASSSNVTLPASPELSFVEKIYVNKNEIIDIENYSTLNEMQSNLSKNTYSNKYMISQVDVSMPLMGQQCGITKSRERRFSESSSLIEYKIPKSAGRNLVSFSAHNMSTVSESIQNKLDTVNIDEFPSSSDSLDRRLEQLLLESAKKITEQNKENMEIDTNSPAVKKQSGSRKRCSTPHKKANVKRKLDKQAGAFVEDECKEYCSQANRKSCPAINIVCYEDNALDKLLLDIEKNAINPSTKRKNAKKDVIKVKILKPKDKTQGNRLSSESKSMNVNNNCGLNDTESGVFLQGLDESSDLIHNHSETCLHVNDCVSDSVELIENLSKSVISLDTSSINSSRKDNGDNSGNNNRNNLSVELFCNNAQCPVDNDEPGRTVRSLDSGNTVFYTPIVSQSSSLMTEDRSPDKPSSQPPPRSSWYLLSEEETTNTKYYDVQQEKSNDRISSFGANLKQLFPIACAIPDLSTISEISKENEGSQKTSLETDYDTLNERYPGYF